MAITDFDYLQTRNQIIEDAFEIVGAKEAGQGLTAEMMEQGVRSLQLMVKAWTNENLRLWNYQLLSFSTVAAQELYDASLDQSVIGIDKAWVLETNEDLPLEIVSYNQYLDFYDKTVNTGRPAAIAYKETPAPSIHIWPSPDAVYTIKTLAVLPLQDFDTASGDGDVPARFQEALVYGLAVRLFAKYPASMNLMQWVQVQAENAFFKAKNFKTSLETDDEIAGFYRTRRC